MYFDNLISALRKNAGKILLFFCFMLIFALFQRLNYMQTEAENAIRENIRLSVGLDSLKAQIFQLEEVVFLQRIMVPETITFADSVYKLDPITQERLYQKIIELMNTKSKMVAANRRYEHFNFIKHILLENGLHPDFFIYLCRKAYWIKWQFLTQEQKVCGSL